MLNRFNRCFCQARHFPHLLGWAALFSFFMLPQAAVAAELSYRLQSPLVGGFNSTLQAAENSRVSLTTQARAKVINDELRVIQQAAQAAANTPEARFLSSIQSQIFFAISQKIATQITTLPAGESGTFQTGDNFVSYMRDADGKTLTVTITTPAGTSVMKLPTSAF